MPDTTTVLGAVRDILTEHGHHDAVRCLWNHARTLERAEAAQLAAEQAARAAAERERDALVAACERLVAALDREKEAIVRAFHFAQVHGHRYNGAGYVEELNATRAALAALGPAPTPTTPTH